MSPLLDSSPEISSLHVEHNNADSDSDTGLINFDDQS